jgi:hypothetical protein
MNALRYAAKQQCDVSPGGQPRFMWQTPIEALASGFASFWGCFAMFVAAYFGGLWLGAGGLSVHVFNTLVWTFGMFFRPWNMIAHLALFILFAMAARSDYFKIRVACAVAAFLISVFLGVFVRHLDWFIPI